MSSRNHRALSIILGSAIVIVAAFAWAQQAGESMLIEQPVDRDIYAADREVEVRSTVDGDFVAAGRQITVGGAVTGDVIVAARNIEIRSHVGDDLRAAGQHVRIMSPVSGHIVAAGQTVTVEQEVGDWAWLAGNTVEVRGNVGSDLRIRATTITIDAEVAGDVELAGDELNLGPNTVVRGDVRWSSSNAAGISPGAQIDGEFIKETPPGLVDDLTAGGTYSLPLNTIVAVMLLFLLFPRPLRMSADRITRRPAWSLLIGFSAFVATPFLAVLLLFSGVGIWLGLAVLFIYLVVLLLGVLTGLFAASDLLLRRFRQQPALWHSLAAIFVTVVAVGLLAKVPRLGFILVVAILSVGVGSLCWNSWTTLRNLGLHKPQPT